MTDMTETPEATIRRLAARSLRMDDHVRQVSDVHEIQGRQGNWDYSPYMRGIFNGLELAMTILEDREPRL